MKLKEIISSNGVATFNGDPFAVCDNYEAVEACGDYEMVAIDPLLDPEEYEDACARLDLDPVRNCPVYRGGYGDAAITVCFDC